MLMMEQVLMLFSIVLNVLLVEAEVEKRLAKARRAKRKCKKKKHKKN